MHNTICDKNSEYSWVQVSFKPSIINVLLSHCGSLTALQHISPEVSVKGFKVCCIAVQWMRLIVICCGMAVKRVGMLVVSAENIKALTVRVKTATLIGKGRYNVTCFVY